LHTELIIIENISLTILCLSLVRNLIRKQEVLDFKNDFNFWMITGVLFYFCLTTPYYTGLQLPFRNWFYWINALCNLTMYCLFIKVFMHFKSH
jgi:hypothetical protein